MKYSVVIVTYNRIKLLKECLECLEQQKKRFDNIIIIDNCSNDGTYDYLEEYKVNHSETNVFHMATNLGGAGGFYEGLGKVDKEMDYVLIIDDDAMLERSYLKIIDENMNPNILAYSGTVKTDGVIDTSHRRRISNHTLMIKTDVPTEEYSNQYFDYDLSTFCGLLLNVNLLYDIGLPQRDYFIWYDDTEYSLRIGKHSVIRNINQAVLNHKTKLAKKDEPLGWKSYYGYRNQWDMGIKYSKHPYIFNIFRLCFHLERIIEYRCRAIFSKEKRDYYRWITHLHIDVIASHFGGKLGKNDKYCFEKQ